MQAVVAVGMISGLSLLISKSVEQVVDSSRRAQVSTAKERAIFHIANLLKNVASCTNTFGGVAIPDGGNLASAVTQIIDKDGIQRFESCLSVGGCDNAYASYVPTARMRLMSFTLIEYDKLTELGKMRIVLLDNRNNEIVETRPFNITTDGSNNIISCYYNDNIPTTEVCDSLNGALEETAPHDYCKSLWIGNAVDNVTNDAYSVETTNFVQVTNDLNTSGPVLVGSSGVTRLSGTGQIDVVGRSHVEGSLNIGTGTFSNEVNNTAGKAQVGGSVWVGSGSRPGGLVDGDLRTSNTNAIYSQGLFTIGGVSNTQNFTAPEALRTAVTAGWVKRQMAEALVSGVMEINNVWNEIHDAATADYTNAEESLREAFCSSVRVRTFNGSYVTAVNSATDCRVMIDHLMERCDVNGNCPTVSASNQVCLGPAGDRSCKTSWPSSYAQVGSMCEAPVTYSKPTTPASEGRPNYTETICDMNKPWLRLVGGQCCPYRF